MTDHNFSRRTLLGWATGGAAALGVPALAALPADDTARFHLLLAEAEDADARLDPMGAEHPGRAVRPPFVDPLGDDYAAALRRATEATLAGLGRIDRARLSAQDAIAFDVLGYRARQTIGLFRSGLFDLQRQASLDPSFGLQVEFPDFVAGAGAPFATPGDYARGIGRLDLFAAYLNTAVARWREGLAAGVVQPRILAEHVLAQVDALLALPIEQSGFYAAILRMPPAIPSADRAHFETAYRAAIADRIYPGYRRWRTFLATEYLPRATQAVGRWAMKGGDALYAAELARHTTTDTPAAAIHALGLGEVARIRASMERARTDIGFKGDLAAFFAYIRNDPRFYCRTPDELLSKFAAIEARIWTAIPRLFARRPKAPFAVQPLPTLGGQRGTGYYRPGPPDGSAPGVLFFNMAMLPTRPIPTLETLTLHEGIPGHHFQINLARENVSLPPLLRYASSTAYTEGWGLYAESLGRELGMFVDPYQWFGRLDMEMLRAVRLVVDTGMHAERWDRQRAIDYMLANTSMAPGDVAVEIDRYIAAPGQACAYKIGELKLRDLRVRATASLGARFDIRDFHDQVLGTGALPLAVLDGKIGRWLSTGGGSAGSGFDAGRSPA